MNKLTLLTDDLTYSKDTKCFSVEVSDLHPKYFLTNKHLMSEIDVKNPGTGVSKTFKHESTDTDGTGEDIYGYRLKSHDGLTLLIIND